MRDHKHYANDLACALKGYRALIVPGVQPELPGTTSWIDQWEQSLPRVSRIRLHDWQTMDWVKWRNSIIASLISIDEPLVIIAEGFGALTAASVAAEYPSKIIAIFLVNPHTPDSIDVQKKLPKQMLHVPSHMIANTYLTTNDSLVNAHWAKTWGADFNCIPRQAGSEYWPEAIKIFSEFLTKTQQTQEALLKIYRKQVSLKNRTNGMALVQ